MKLVHCDWEGTLLFLYHNKIALACTVYSDRFSLLLRARALVEKLYEQECLDRKYFKLSPPTKDSFIRAITNQALTDHLLYDGSKTSMLVWPEKVTAK